MRSLHTLPLIVGRVAMVLIAAGALNLAGCKGVNAGVAVSKGQKTGDLSAGIDESSSPFVILDLASGARTTALAVPDLITNSAYRTTKMVFRRVVGLGSNYLLGVFEVTQGQWQAIAPAATQDWARVDPAVVDSAAIAANRPAFNLSNDGIVAGLAAYNLGKVAQLALPSDAQWEFACAAGGSGAWSWGDANDRDTVQANAVVAETAAIAGPAPVGQLAPNAWGFYDMHGNVWEWTGTGGGAHARGGSWHDGVALARTSNVADSAEGVFSDTHHALIGMRLVLRQ